MQKLKNWIAGIWLSALGLCMVGGVIETVCSMLRDFRKSLHDFTLFQALFLLAVVGALSLLIWITKWSAHQLGLE